MTILATESVRSTEAKTSNPTRKEDTPIESAESTARTVVLALPAVGDSAKYRRKAPRREVVMIERENTEFNELLRMVKEIVTGQWGGRMKVTGARSTRSGALMLETERPEAADELCQGLTERMRDGKTRVARPGDRSIVRMRNLDLDTGEAEVKSHSG